MCWPLRRCGKPPCRRSVGQLSRLTALPAGGRDHNRPPAGMSQRPSPLGRYMPCRHRPRRASGLSSGTVGAMSAEIDEETLSHWEGTGDAPAKVLAAEVRRLRAQRSELLPFLTADVRFGLEIGPPPVDHPGDGCDDCLAYAEAQTWSRRLASGEFGPTDHASYQPRI
jgi:hypothetical protein